MCIYIIYIYSAYITRRNHIFIVFQNYLPTTKLKQRMHNSHVSRSGRTMAQRRKHILHTFYNYGGNLNLHFTLNVWDLLIISSRRSSPRSSKPTLIVREMETKMWENSANRKWKREPGIFFHVTRTQPLRKLCRHGDSQDITAAWNVSMMSHCAVQIAAKSGCLRGDVPPRKRISFTRDTKFRFVALLSTIIYF